MWGVLLVLLYFAAALIAAAVLLQPDRFIVRRTAVIDAAPEQVFRQINDLHNWAGWSPWASLDPAARIDYFGAACGAGASVEWSGDRSVGAGRMTIVDSLPAESVTLKLDLLRPFQASHDVYFSLTPENGGDASRTRVDWSLVGRAGLLAKALNLLMSREKSLGGRFEQGLSNLQAACAA